MKVLVDTNLITPVVLEAHPHHVLCTEFLNYLRKKHQVVILNTHLIAELYSNLTKIPKLKIDPKDARLAIRGLVEEFESVELTVEDYLLAVDRCAELDLVSGVIFDALHFQAAIKAEVDVLYTGNLRDFDRLVTDEITFRVESPLPQSSSKKRN